MKLNWKLKPNEERQQQVDGKYLIITKTAGPIEVTAGGSIPVEMDINERLHLRGINPHDRNIKIKNITGGCNDVEIITSDLLIDKRTSADLANALVSIADGERIGIDPNQNIVQAIVQNSIMLDPDGNMITVAEDQCIGIDPFKNTIKLDAESNVIRMEGNQVIGIDPNKNNVAATISNAIKIDPLHNTVKIEPIAKLLTQYQSLETIELSDDEVSIIEANPNRKTLILTTDKENEDIIWLGEDESQGIPLDSDERINLEITEPLTITGESGNTLYIAEIIELPQ